MSEIVIYEGPGGIVEVRLGQEMVWLSLNQIADLFGRDKSVISKHLRNVFKEGEIEETATVANFATVQNEGGRTVSRDIAHYNLDAILSVGYRVNSKQGTLRDFVDSAGNPGYFQQQYQVYGRAGQACRYCGAAIRQLRQGQRSTFYCPGCQT